MERSGKRFEPPPRWLNCPRKGIIVGGHFIPFKTPLDHKYDDEVPDECKFNVQMFQTTIQASYQRKVGLIIDLTNTTKFYNEDEVESLGINYVKLQCQGKDGPPEREQTLIFLDVVDKFIKTKPNEIIGVHCTHGFNRTGFLISSYLVEREDWSIEAAVHTFAQCRPPGIYKGGYLKELFRMYDEESAAPPPPVLPDWCDEEYEGVDDDGNEEGSPSKRRRTEHVKLNPTFMEGVPGATHVQDQPRLSNIQHKVQDMCGWESSGFPGSQPVSMNMNNIKLLHSKRYYVSWKADGTRYMMLIDGPGQTYLIDRDNCVFQVKNLEFPKRKDLNAHLANTLLDGELVIDEDKVNCRKIPRYLIFDIIKFEGLDVGKTDFTTRLSCIKREIHEPRSRKIEQRLLDKMKEPFGIRHMPFRDLAKESRVQDTKKLLSLEFFTNSVRHETDGLVFQPADKTDVYTAGRQDDVLKWKPPHLNSIDFKLSIKQSQIGESTETKGLLHVGGFDRPIDQIKLTKDLHQYNNKIIECCWNPEGPGWKFMRERTDKSFPNAYSTAMGVMESIKSPVTEKKLLDFIRSYCWRPEALRHPANPTSMGPPPK